MLGMHVGHACCAICSKNYTVELLGHWLHLEVLVQLRLDNVFKNEVFAIARDYYLS